LNEIFGHHWPKRLLAKSFGNVDLQIWDRRRRDPVDHRTQEGDIFIDPTRQILMPHKV